MSRVTFAFGLLFVSMCVSVLLGNMLGALMSSVTIVSVFLSFILVATIAYKGSVYLFYRSRSSGPYAIWGQETLVKQWVPLCCVTLVSLLISVVLGDRFYDLALQHGVQVAFGCLFFPVVYSFSDVVSEVFGYRLSRKCAHITSAINIMFALVLASMLTLCASLVTEGHDIKNAVLSLYGFSSSTFRVVIAGGLTAFIGSLVNDKIFRHFQRKDSVYKFSKRRAISSTVAEITDSTLFFHLAFKGFGNDWATEEVLFVMILCNFLCQILVEMAMLPLTKALVVHFRYLNSMGKIK